MFNPKALFKERVKAHIQLLNRYLRYIFNGHFMIALMFIVVTVSIYYEQWLKTLSPQFPATIMITFFLTGAVLYNPIQSFLKEPDRIFLIVKEEEMGQYFALTKLYTYIVQLYVVALTLAIIGPLYFKFYGHHSPYAHFLLGITVLIIKGWNLLLRWQLLQTDYNLFTYIERGLRFGLTLVLFYTLLKGNNFLIVALIYIVYFYIVFRFARKDTKINWLHLIQNDSQRLASFYRFVSMFAQVPHKTGRLRKHRLLSRLIYKWTPIQNRNTYAYLYKLTFIRSGDYLSLYIRLIVIGLLFIIFVPNFLLKILFAILFIYMFSFQLQSLFYHHEMNVWLRLYPQSFKKRKTAFIRFSKQLTFCQILLYAIVFIGLQMYLFSLYVFSIGIVYNYLFHNVYVKKKINEAL